MIRHFIILLILVIAHLEIGAQCGTPTLDMNGEIPKPFLKHQIDKLRSSSSPPYVFQIYTHILRNTDGSNAAITESSLEAKLDAMADLFAEHDICFVWLGNDYIDNTTWNINYNINMISGMRSFSSRDDAIDIYVHGNYILDGAAADTFGGYAYAIPSPYFSIRGPVSSRIYAHEMGHCMGLLHTFSIAGGFECPNGFNCATAGDYVCDTNADYTDSEDDVENCVYLGNQVLLCDNGFHPYDPPVNNIMSYNSIACTDEFTPGQRTRMYLMISLTQFLQDRLATLSSVLSNTTTLDDINLGAQQSIIIGNLGVGDETLFLGTESVFTAGQEINILPGTTFSPTWSGSVVQARIKPIDCN